MTRVHDLFPERYRRAVEEELGRIFASQQGLLYDMLRYQLGSTDEQGTPLSGFAVEGVHSLLCLLSCEALSGESDPARPAAAAVHLVRNYALIHEDVQSGSPNRGERPSVWWVWGPGQAINAGDGMHALARLSLMRLQEYGLSPARVLQAMRLLDRSCLTMCEGQHMDLAFQERLDVGVDSYIAMASGKAGALMSCAMGLGALAATEDDSTVEAFTECGKNLGIACQISADIRDLWGSPGSPTPSSSVLNKSKLLPIVYLLDTGDVGSKRALGTIYFKRVLNAQDVQQVVAILDGSSALDYSREKVSEYCEMALASLEGAAMSDRGREELEKLCRQMVMPEG